MIAGPGNIVRLMARRFAVARGSDVVALDALVKVSA
jgi:hypothetical protein